MKRFALLLTANPPHGGAAGSIEMANALERMDAYLRSEYPEWDFRTE